MVLSITDEDSPKVANLPAARLDIKYPILTDPGHKVASAFHVDGIPQTSVFDSEGNLIAQAMDMRTQRHFWRCSPQAGL